MCYANTTTATATDSTTGCCWFVFVAYIYAAIHHANFISTTFLPDPTASTYATAFSASLISPSRNPSVTSNLNANLDADERHYLCPTDSAMRSATNLSNASRLCTNSRSDLSVDQLACVDCQDAVITATFDLLNVTNSTEFVPCGMAVTISVRSPAAPSLHRFRSNALCMLKVLENVGSLGTSNLLLSTPTPPPQPSAPFASLIPTSSSSRTSAVCEVIVSIDAGTVVVAVVVSDAAIGVTRLGGGSCCKIIFV